MTIEEDPSGDSPRLGRNPDWTRDETVLALELYFRDRPRLLDDLDPQVEELSDLLLMLARRDGVSGLPSFRNPAGVAMKLANLSRLDIEFKSDRKGLKNGSAIEGQVWREFGGDPDKLKRTAASIRRGIMSPSVQGSQENSFDATTLHRPEERPEHSRIWVTGMWGFTPNLHGYVGFTNPGGRKRYLMGCQPGDLMIIVGQNGETADPRDVGRVLGLVELDPRPVDETECMSAESYQEKV